MDDANRAQVHTCACCWNQLTVSCSALHELQCVTSRQLASQLCSELFQWQLSYIPMHAYTFQLKSTHSEMQWVTWVAVRYNTSTCQSTCLWDILIRSCADINPQWVAVRYNTSTCLSTLFWVGFNHNNFTCLCMPMYCSWNQVKACCSVLHHVNLPVDLVQTYACLSISAEINSQWVAVRYNTSTCQSTCYWDIFIPSKHYSKLKRITKSHLWFVLMQIFQTHRNGLFITLLTMGWLWLVGSIKL